MIRFDIEIGSFTVIGTGSVVLGSFGNFRCTIDDGSERLQFEFAFEKDTENTAARYQMEVVSPTIGKIRLINFNNSLGEGIVNPLPIGTLGTLPLFVSFVSHAIGEGRLFNYTFMTRKTGDNLIGAGIRL